MIVGYQAGGPTDVIARIIAQKLSDMTRQQIVVDNRAGANAIIGSDLAAKAPPDGYTLMMVAFPHTVNPALYASLPYDTLKDFSPVMLATSGPMLLVAHPSIPARNLKELIALARAHPMELTCASSGVGATGHLALALLNHRANIRIAHIPYKGSTQGLTDLLGGHVSMYFGGIVSLLPSVKTGRLNGIAVSTVKRSEAAPSIPTIAESGVPGYEVSGWYGIVAPARTPKTIIDWVNAELVKVLADTEVKEKLAANGAEIVASTPDNFGSYIESEMKKWKEIVKSANIKQQ